MPGSTAGVASPSNSVIVRSKWPDDEPKLLPNHVRLAAGWASLLARFQDSHEFFHAPGSFLPYDTDYLPSDLQAAPTLGTIRTVVELAAFAGCDRVMMAEGYPTARGGNLQLSFRDHPALGMVAHCQAFPGVDTYTM